MATKKAAATTEMTVGQLIEQLTKLPRNQSVLVSSFFYESSWGFTPVETVSIGKVRNVNGKKPRPVVLLEIAEEPKYL